MMLPSSPRWSSSIVLQLTCSDIRRCLSRHKGLVIFPAGTSLESLWPFTIEQTIDRATFGIQIFFPLTLFLKERTFSLVLRKRCQHEHWFRLAWINYAEPLASVVSVGKIYLWVRRQNVYFPKKEIQPDLAQTAFQKTWKKCFEDTALLLTRKDVCSIYIYICSKLIMKL